MPDDTTATVRTVVLIRYLNQSGALITVTAAEYGTHSLMEWSCSGCLDGTTGHHRLPTVREAANGHAATCRALPQPQTAAA